MPKLLCRVSVVVGLAPATALALECPAQSQGRPLDGVMVFSGHPSQLASQVPVTQGRTTFWDVGRDFFLECHYRGTGRTVVIALAPTVRRCTAVGPNLRCG